MSAGRVGSGCRRPRRASDRRGSCCGDSVPRVGSGRVGLRVVGRGWRVAGCARGSCHGWVYLKYTR
eukprot:1782110-Lingulodinium_polyedra.AAC.1